jgi:hypothetical protein
LENYIHEKLALWQGRLKLGSWTISVVISHPADLRSGTKGNIRWDAEKKTAVIRVLDASDDHMPFHAALQDVEFTIVHELLHLGLASLPRDEASRVDEETAVNNVAGALLQLDRRD